MYEANVLNNHEVIPNPEPARIINKVKKTYQLASCLLNEAKKAIIPNRKHTIEKINPEYIKYGGT